MRCVRLYIKWKYYNIIILLNYCNASVFFIFISCAFLNQYYSLLFQGGYSESKEALVTRGCDEGDQEVSLCLFPLGRSIYEKIPPNREQIDKKGFSTEPVTIFMLFNIGKVSFSLWPLEKGHFQNGFQYGCRELKLPISKTLFNLERCFWCLSVDFYSAHPTAYTGSASGNASPKPGKSRRVTFRGVSLTWKVSVLFENWCDMGSGLKYGGVMGTGFKDGKIVVWFHQCNPCNIIWLM